MIPSAPRMLIGRDVKVGRGAHLHFCLCQGHDTYLSSPLFKFKGEKDKQRLSQAELAVLTNSPFCTGNGDKCPTNALEGKSEAIKIALKQLMYPDGRKDYQPVEIKDGESRHVIPPLHGFVSKPSTLRDQKLGVKKGKSTLGQLAMTGLICKKGSSHGDDCARIIAQAPFFTVVIEVKGFAPSLMPRYAEWEPQGALGTIQRKSDGNLKYILFLDSEESLKESYLKIFVNDIPEGQSHSSTRIGINGIDYEVPIKADPIPMDSPPEFQSFSESIDSPLSFYPPPTLPPLASSPTTWDQRTCREICYEMDVKGNLAGVLQKIRETANMPYGPIHGPPPSFPIASSHRFEPYSVEEFPPHIEDDLNGMDWCGELDGMGDSFLGLTD